MVDARLGVWHASVHPLPPPAQADAADLIGWRTHKPPPGALTTQGTFGNDPTVLVGDWCRVALRYHWGEFGPDDVLNDVGFLLAFREEDLVIEAAHPLPKGSYEQENPDSDLAPERFRLGFGISLINYLAQAYASTCWRALETHYLEHASLWCARMDQTRGHNILASFFIRSPLPAALDERFKDFVKAKFKFVKERG